MTADDLAGAALIPLPTPEEAAALLLELAADDADADEDGDTPLCEVCGLELVLAGDFPLDDEAGAVCRTCEASYHAAAEERF